MGFTYKLSRRLAQIQFFVLTLFAAACSDAITAPEETLEDASQIEVMDLGTPSLALTALNQPTNFVKITSRPFNYKVESGWKDRGDAAFSIATDAGAPVSPSSIGRANFRNGFRGGAAPINTWFMVPGKKRNVYLSYWMRLSANWDGHNSGVNKIVFFQINRGNKLAIIAYGAGSGGLVSQVRVQGINENPITRNLYSNVSNPAIIRGKWQRWELVLRANTNGQPNGVVEWWVDGKLAGHHTNVNFVPQGANNFWEAVKWNPTWGGTGDILAQSQDMWIDEAYVSGI